MPSIATVKPIKALAFAAGLVAATALAATTARTEIQPGRLAPDFTLKDSTGKEVKLSSFKGKTVVLEWTNHECPYVRKHYETSTMQTLQKDASKDGVVWLTLISSAPGQQGHVNGLEAEKLTADRKAAPTAVLFDPTGKVGKAYEARVTPHMFVIDKDGMLRYQGGIDDKPSANHADVKTAKPYVREALAAVKAGATPNPAVTRAYGCSIKYQS